MRLAELCTRWAQISVLLCSLLLQLVSCIPSPAPVGFGDINAKLPALTPSDFSTSTSKGMWLVEFYSPSCPHCRHFAPVWQDVVEVQEHLALTADFHMSRVNCLTFGDLCNEQNIEGYPTLKLYADSKYIEDYTGKRKYDDLTSYVTARARDYQKAKHEAQMQGQGQNARH
ncbi:Thioredoxin/protein disulfide isomerase [Ceraceosorus bombacis]|uniref:Thioredoxin/protein disulfide isomerase n=1 Tax=Ceraceosorus bombacis TaxID=401625 RepID=A0A0P1BHC4_9BASI|nr:Thioredoxin/protein disulfide isomerase [Ceraceosorus bombacis]